MWPSPLPPQARTNFRANWRSLVLAIGSLETLALAMFGVLMLQSSDPLGAAIGRSVTKLMSIPYAALGLPGIILAYYNRWLPLALALVFLAVPAAIILWRYA